MLSDPICSLREVQGDCLINLYECLSICKTLENKLIDADKTQKNEYQRMIYTLLVKIVATIKLFLHSNMRFEYTNDANDYYQNLVFSLHDVTETAEMIDNLIQNVYKPLADKQKEESWRK